MDTTINCTTACKFITRQMDIVSKGYDGTTASNTIMNCLQDISDGFTGIVGGQLVPQQYKACCDDFKLTVSYSKRKCELPEEEEFDCKTWWKDCEVKEPTTLEENCIDVEITKSVKHSVTFSSEYCGCQDELGRFTKMMRDFTREMRMMYQTKLLKCVFGDLGNYHPKGQGKGANSETAPATVKLFTKDAKPNGFGLYAPNREYKLQCGEGARYYALSGSPYIDAYLFASGIFNALGCCYDPAKANNTGATFCNDIAIQDCLEEMGLTAAAPNPMVTFQEGAFRILEWFQFENGRGQETRPNGSHVFLPSLSDNTIIRTKLDLAPYNNGQSFIVDAKMIYSACDNTVTIDAVKFFDVFCPPTDASNCNDTNGKLLWNADCGDPSCLDWCAPVADPVEGEG